MRVFKTYSGVDQVVLYGSRAIGNYKEGSDIDLCLLGENLTLDEQFAIESDIDDLLLPYKIDLSIYKYIKNKKLIDHIDNAGIPLLH